MPQALEITGNWPTWEWQVEATKAFFGGLKGDLRTFVWDISRQLGKTTLLKAIVIKCAQMKPGKYWYLAPAYDRAEAVYNECCDVLWPLIKAKHCTARKISAGWQIEFSRELGGTLIEFKSLGNPEHLRGATLRGVVIDEVGLVSGRVIRKIVEPMLVALDGWIIYCGTPSEQGESPDPDYFPFIWEWATKDPTWWRIHRDFRAHPVPRVVQEIEKKRERIPVEEFAREYLALFPDDDLYRLPPLGLWGPSTDIHTVPPGTTYFTGVDLADSEAELHDPAAVVTFGIAPGGDVYVVHAEYLDNPSEVLEACYNQKAFWKDAFAGIKIQKSSFDKGFKHTVDAAGMARGIYLPIEMVDIGGASKRRRIIQMEPLARNNKLFVQESLMDFQREWHEFPDKIKAVGGQRLRMDHHYDMLDACAPCVQEALAYEHRTPAPPTPKNTVAHYIRALKAKRTGVTRLDSIYRT